MTTYGGSERLIAEILDLYPGSQLHALIHRASAYRRTPLSDRVVRTSFLQYLPAFHRYYRALLPAMPFAIENMRLDRNRVVLSVSHAVAHGVRTPAAQTHIAYVCTPMRYAWHLRADYLRVHGLDGPLTRWLANWTLACIRSWDRRAAQRADHLLAISKWTAERAEHAWGRTARVIYPPVDTDRFQPAAERDRFYLLVMRLVPYKMGIEIVSAFNQLRLPLIVIGSGTQLRQIARSAGESVTVLGYQPDSVVTDLMNRARAFVYMAAEDFGIAMVEAQAAGCPVVAYRRGGAGEIVADGETGLLYSEQTAQALAQAVSNFERSAASFGSQSARRNALRFSRTRFREEFRDYMRPFLNA